MFFTLSKVLWFVAKPTNLMMILLTLGVVLMWTRWSRFGRRLVAAVVAVLLLFAVIPFGDPAMRALENRFPRVVAMPNRVDGILILGGVVEPRMSAVRGAVSIGSAAERITEGATLARRFPDARVVFSGGSGKLTRRQHLKEAHYVLPLFRQLGVPESRIVLEDRARNTFENAVLVREKVAPSPDDVWILVTSAFHMPRSVSICRARSARSVKRVGGWLPIRSTTRPAPNAGSPSVSVE